MVRYQVETFENLRVYYLFQIVSNLSNIIIVITKDQLGASFIDVKIK